MLVKLSSSYLCFEAFFCGRFVRSGETASELAQVYQKVDSHFEMCTCFLLARDKIDVSSVLIGRSYCHQSSGIVRQRSSCKLKWRQVNFVKTFGRKRFYLSSKIWHRTAHARANTVYPRLFRKRKLFRKFANRL